MGVSSTATDGFDANMDTLIGTSLTGSAGVYHEFDPSTWTGPTGFYRRDYRAMPGALESKTWEPISVWAAPTFAQDTMYYSMETYGVPPDDRQYLLELLQVPHGVVGPPTVGTEWVLPMDELFTLALPTFRTDNGLEGYQFAFTLAVPEPSQLGILFFAVLAGWIVHQRRC